MVDFVSYNLTERGRSIHILENGTFFGDNSPGSGLQVFPRRNITKLSKCESTISIHSNHSIFPSGNISFFVSMNLSMEGTASLEIFVNDIYGDKIKEYRPFTNRSIDGLIKTRSYNFEIESGTFFYVNATGYSSCGNLNTLEKRSQLFGTKHLIKNLDDVK